MKNTRITEPHAKIIMTLFIVSISLLMITLFPEKFHAGVAENFIFYKFLNIDRKYLLIFDFNMIYLSGNLLLYNFLCKRLPEKIYYNLFFILSPMLLVVINTTLPLIYNLFGAAIIFDDAYMFIRYADNILQGYGYAWNKDGIRTYGATSIVYTYFIVLLRNLDVGNMKYILLLGSCLPLPVYIFIQNKILKENIKNEGLRLYSFFLLVLLVFGGFLSALTIHGTTGMDTMLAVTTNALFIYSILKIKTKNNYKYIVAAVFCAYLTFLTRPDNVLYATIFPGLYFLLVIKKDWLHVSLRFYIAFGILILLDSIVKYHIFGDVLPLTFYAKQHAFLEGYLEYYKWRPLEYLLTMTYYLLPVIFTLVIVTNKKNITLVAAFIIPVLITYLYYFNVVQIMGFFARFYIPALPFFITIFFLLLDWPVIDKIKLNKPQVVIKILITFLLFSTFFYSLDKYYEFKEKQNKIDIQAKYPDADIKSKLPGNIEQIFCISSQLPDGKIMAASEHGRLAATYNNLKILDLVGLNDRYIAKNGITEKYLKENRPDLFFMIHKAYVKNYLKIIYMDFFKDNYIFYPGAADLGVAVLKEDSQTRKIVEDVIQGDDCAIKN